MNHKMKFIFTILIIFITIISIGTITFAEKWTPDKFKIIDSDTDEVKTIGGKIVGIIQIVGTIVAVAMLMIIGIKYVLGSAEERAEYKKTLLPYFIGSVLIFGASNLAQIIYNWASKL